MPFIFTMPKLSPTMEEGTVVKWHKKEGDFVAEQEVLLEIATDKATVEHTALDAGWLKKILIPEGGSATINQPIALFTAEENESIDTFTIKTGQNVSTEEVQIEHQEKKLEKPAQTAPFPLTQPAFVPEAPLPSEKKIPTTKTERFLASPLARRLAQKRGLDLSTVEGSGPGGRILNRDLEKAQPAGLVTFGKVESPKLAAGTYEETPLTPVRKVIAKRLQESKSFIPHFYVKQVIDAEPIIALREQLKAFQLNVTFNDIIIKGCALALRAHPQVNAGFNSVNQTLIQFKTIDISVAVTVEGGLITPIIRHADYKNLGQISLEVKQLAEKARAMKLKEQEYKGGSFCISNLGMFGITEFCAVINPPQAAILAVGGIEQTPIIKENQVVCGKTLHLTLSADHRVIDGALAAQFIKTLQKILENPVVLTL